MFRTLDRNSQGGYNMQRRISLSIQEEKFKEECKLIDLRYEYHGYTGDERYAIISELTEKELRYRYSNIIKRYEPFILLSMECGEIIDEFHRNEDKFKKRAKRSKDYFGYEDGIT